MTDVRVGDWIRFIRGGVLVIDEVRYLVPRSSYDSTLEALTLAHGHVPFGSIVEVRHDRP